MKKVCHIYLYGDIVDFQSEDIEFWGCVSLTTIKNAYLLNPDVEEVIVHIHSCGGNLFEALAMYDFLVSLKANGIKITTIVEGMCASAATVVLLAGDDRKLMENSRFLIHNPMSWAEGTAAEIQKVASFLVDEQERLVEFYVIKTGGDAEQLQSIMDTDEFVDADTALELKFATEVVSTMTALAKVQNRAHQKIIFNQSINPQKKKAMNATKKTKLQGAIAKAKDLLKALLPEGDAGEVTNTVLTLDDGTDIYFEDAEIAVDTAVFSDEAMTTPCADGDYAYNDGDTITVAGGVVTVITPKTSAENETDAETIARLTLEVTNQTKRADDNEALCDQLEASLDEATTVLNTIKTTWKPTARGAQPNKPANGGVRKITKPANNGGGGDLKAGVKAEKEARKAAAKGNSTVK